MNKLERAYDKGTPSCGSCGWCPAFYELDFNLVESESTENMLCYWAPCVSKDDYEDRETHRGHYLYLYIERSSFLDSRHKENTFKEGKR